LIAFVIGLEIVALLLYGAIGKLSAISASKGVGAPETPCQYAASAANPVAAENTCPGTDGWRPDLPFGAQQDIEAFTSPISVNVGERVNIYVSTTAPSYSFRVYRMGWYQGLGGRAVYESHDIQGIKQPPPVVDPATRMVSASNWHDPVTLSIPTSWVSGVYIVKLVSSAGYMRYTYFILRNDASHAQILFQSSVLTNQAYNNWGGRSLYGDANGNFNERSYAVSLDRPDVVNAGLSNFSRYEYDLLSWLEREGYNVTYTTDIDTELRGQLLLNHQLFLAAGHDEYWSSVMRANVTHARDSGVSLAFFGANDVYWNVRLESSPLGPDEVMVCYKDASLDPLAASDPSLSTSLWRESPLNKPQASLVGADYGNIVKGPAPMVLSDGAAPFLLGTTLHPGSVLPGLVGAEFGPQYENLNTGEFDTYPSSGSVPPSLTIIAASKVQVLPGEESQGGSSGESIATATLYTAPSGARVFDAGTFWWGLGLNAMHVDGTTPQGTYSSLDFQRFTSNLLSYLMKITR
jgi:hypothetical protein